MSRLGVAAKRATDRPAGTVSTKGTSVRFASALGPLSLFKSCGLWQHSLRVQELCESRGGRPGLLVLVSLMVSVDVKQH